MPPEAIPALPSVHKNSSSLGAAIKLPLPFNKQQPPHLLYNSVTAANRSACTSATVLPNNLAASPACGVSIQLSLFMATPLSLRSDNRFNPSASTTNGIPAETCLLNASCSNVRDHSLRPKPGPITITLALASSSSTGASSSSVPNIMISGNLPRNAGLWAERVITLTKPAPLRWAASAAIRAAPP